MAKLYEIFEGKELKIAELIQQRRRQMIVHSRLYYILDESIVDDHQWANWALDLMCLQNEFPYIAKLVPYAKEFANWDASSGFHLPLEEGWAVTVCERLLRLRRT